MPKEELVTIDDHELALSNLTKVLFPGAGVTKGEVIAYYSEVAEIILPHLQSRPLTLKRYPDGVTKEHFYEKNAPSYTPKWVETFEVPRESGGAPIRYVRCNDRMTPTRAEPCRPNHDAAKRDRVAHPIIEWSKPAQCKRHSEHLYSVAS